jgi:hypothetical protein
MSWSRSRKSAIAAGVLGLASGAAATALCGACSSAEKLSGAGGACFLVTDCQEGLVCVPKVASQPNGTRVCSNNVSSIVPGDTGTQEPDAEGIPTTLPTFDAEPVPDALMTSDGSAPEDATTPPPQQEAAPPPMEASSPPPMEASTPPVEASAPPADASAHD